MHSMQVGLVQNEVELGQWHINLMHSSTAQDSFCYPRSPGKEVILSLPLLRLGCRVQTEARAIAICLPYRLRLSLQELHSPPTVAPP